jgi:hypothetical protein
MIDLLDIKVQPFCGWGEEIFSNPDEHHHYNGEQFLEPAIMKSSSVKPSNVNIDH